MTLVSRHICVYFPWAVHESFYSEYGVHSEIKCAKAKLEYVFLTTKKISSLAYTTSSWSHFLNCSSRPSGHICICVSVNLLLFELTVLGYNERVFHLLFSCICPLACLQLWKATHTSLNTETWSSEKEMLLSLSNTLRNSFWSWLTNQYRSKCTSIQLQKCLEVNICNKNLPLKSIERI